MGSDEAKIEKKRLKAQVKAEKARAKSGLLPGDKMEAEQPQESISEPEKASPEASQPQEPFYKSEKEPWYKDPHWIKAIGGLATLVVMVITLIIALQ